MGEIYFRKVRKIKGKGYAMSMVSICILESAFTYNLDIAIKNHKVHYVFLHFFHIAAGNPDKLFAVFIPQPKCRRSSPLQNFSVKLTSSFFILCWLIHSEDVLQASERAALVIVTNSSHILTHHLLHLLVQQFVHLLGQLLGFSSLWRVAWTIWANMPWGEFLNCHLPLILDFGGNISAGRLVVEVPLVHCRRLSSFTFL